jgi:long-chain acyl-CoA synthetase
MIKANTSPAPLELKLAINKDIDQICLVGTGIPQPIALITLSELGKPNQNIIMCWISCDNQSNKPHIEKHEKIEKVIVMKEDWSIENGLTTPTEGKT